MIIDTPPGMFRQLGGGSLWSPLAHSISPPIAPNLPNPGRDVREQAASVG